VTVDVVELERDWDIAPTDAGLSHEDCLLVVLDREPQGSDSLLLDPGFLGEWTPFEPLTDDQLKILNSDRWRDRYRVLVAPPENRAARLGLLRDALEHARQYQHDSRLYHLGGQLRDAMASVYTGDGSASILKLHPVWADAAAAGAALARKHAQSAITDDVLWGPYGALLRTAWEPGDLESLAQRMLVWAALHRSAVEDMAETCGGIHRVISRYSDELLPAWRTLIEDAELTRLARAARLSIPPAARIQAATQYRASVWDRVLDLLDRGMARGGSLMSPS
jgi:hypothetical protein